MTSPEVFYLHIHGEQRGPYTHPQIDHLLNSGLIATETLYWREGLDQWQPVTNLVKLRKRANPWVKPLVICAVVLVLGLTGRFFGSVILLGWREANQHEYTAKAAYWRARSVVRADVSSSGLLIDFHDLADASVDLKPPRTATVVLRGEVSDPAGRTRKAAWTVPMDFEERTGEWTGGPVGDAGLAP